MGLVSKKVPKDGQRDLLSLSNELPKKGRGLHVSYLYICSFIPVGDGLKILMFVELLWPRPSL